MATLSTGALTLADYAKRTNQDGSVAAIIELLTQRNQILTDMTFIEGNLPVGHQITQRTGLPTAYWRLTNQGVATSKSTTAQVIEQCGMLEAWSEIDVDVANLNGNTAAFRLSEATPFIEAMNQAMAQALFYGNSGINPEQITGLAPRYSSLSGGNATNLISAGTVTGGDGTSIWLVGWSPNGVTGIFPKGSNAGIIHQNLGEVTVETTAGIGGTRMRAYQDRFQWKTGIALSDWRYVVRICNIDTSALVADTAGTTLKLIEYMSRAIDRLPSLMDCRPVFYMNRTVASILRVQSLNKSNAALSVQDGLKQLGDTGHGNMAFLGIPVRICDQLLGNEATIS